MGWLSETMCFQTGGCMLIAEVGAPCAAHPALQTSYCEKTGLLSTLDLIFRHSNIAWSTKVHSRCQHWIENIFKGCRAYFSVFSTVLGFLMKILERPYEYSSVGTWRSAISTSTPSLWEARRVRRVNHNILDTPSGHKQHKNNCIQVVPRCWTEERIEENNIEDVEFQKWRNGKKKGERSRSRDTCGQRK